MIPVLEKRFFIAPSQIPVNYKIYLLYPPSNFEVFITVHIRKHLFDDLESADTLSPYIIPKEVNSSTISPYPTCLLSSKVINLGTVWLALLVTTKKNDSTVFHSNSSTPPSSSKYIHPRAMLNGSSNLFHTQSHKKP